MDRIKLMLVFILLLVSCKNGAEKNYIIISRILQYPDSLKYYKNDTNISSNDFMNSEYYTSEKILYLSEYIKKHFTCGFKKNKELKIAYYSEFQIKNQEKKYVCDLYHILITSKKDSSKVLYFLFSNKSGKTTWKIKNIWHFDPFADREYIEIEHKKK